MGKIDKKNIIISRYFAFIIGGIAGIIICFYHVYFYQFIQKDYLGFSLLGAIPVTIWHLVSNSNNSMIPIIITHIMFYGFIGLVFSKWIQKIRKRKFLFCIVFACILLIMNYLFLWIDALLLGRTLEKFFHNF